MGPKLLGGTVSLLAAAFVLALPSMFKVEPADEVEPIRFGPPPMAKLAQAVRVIPSGPAFSAPATIAPSSTPLVVAGSGRDEDGHATAGTQGASAQGAGDDVHPGAGEDESQGGAGAGNGTGTAEDDGADLDDVDDDSEVGERDDLGEDDEVNEIDEDDLGDDKDDEEDD
jgi:hypothetical protein